MTPPASSYCILFINIYKQLDLIIPLLSYEVATYLYILDIVRVPAIYKVRTCMYGIPCINDILVWRTLQVLYSFAQLPVAISSVTFWHFFPFCSDGQSKGANSDRIKKTFFDHPFCFFVTEKTSQTREEIRDDVDSSCQGGGHGTGGKRWNAKQGMKTEEITPPPPRQKQTARLRRIGRRPTSLPPYTRGSRDVHPIEHLVEAYHVLRTRSRVFHRIHLRLQRCASSAHA